MPVLPEILCMAALALFGVILFYVREDSLSKLLDRLSLKMAFHMHLSQMGNENLGLVFRYRSKRGQIKFQRDRGESWSYTYELTWGPPDYWAEICLPHDGYPNLLPDALRSQTYGSREFRQRFVVRIDQGVAPADDFSPELEAVLWKLHRRFAEHVQIALGRSGVKLRYHGHPSHSDEFIRLMDLLLELADTIAPVSERGHRRILQSLHEFPEEMISITAWNTPDLAEVQCPVCGEAIESAEQMVFCGKCKTPHHRECWEFNTACAMYGCQHTAFASVTVQSLN